VNLRQLEAKFVKRTDEGRRNVDSKGEADGVDFLCPKCYGENGGPVGTHRIVCWAPHIQVIIAPGPGRWSMHGSSIDDLTLVAQSSSVKLNGGCDAHFFVKGGMIEMC
jgi:hypothetical protein